jgi:uncharacterized protein YjbI with pentapeptide repeats
MWRLKRTGDGWRSRLTLIGRYIVGLAACLVPIGLAFAAATFPGERMDEWIGERQWIPPNRLTAWLGQKDREHGPQWTSFHNLLFNSRMYRAHRPVQNESLFATTLDLRGFDALEAAKIDDSKKLDSIKQTLILTERHLESADFNFADLRKADLIGAQLQGALLVGAQLQGASLDLAQLQGASLDYAKLQGASLYEAQLQGASLFGAQLQGASLDFAKLQGASLYEAQLQGASLDLAELQGASLDQAELQGAGLVWAQLQGASLDLAQLQGANLQSANLQGASLAGAQLRGAWLVWAQLQGASLERAELAGAALDNAFVWRARFSLASIEAIAHQEIVWDSKYRKDRESVKDIVSDPKPWTEASYLALKKLIEEKVATPHSVIEKSFVQSMTEQSGGSYRPPAAAGRDAALKRIEILDPDKPFEFEADVPKWRKKIKGQAVGMEAYQKAVARALKALACSGDADAVYVVRGLLKQDTHLGAQAPGLVEAIVQPKVAKDCPVSAALTEQEKAELRKLAK